MTKNRCSMIVRVSLLLGTMLVSGTVQNTASAQQVVQRGPLGYPSGLQDENGQWSAPVPLLDNADVALFMPDVSNVSWLDHNAENFLKTGQYTLTLLSFYKTRRVCRTDQVVSGFSDAAHIDACNVIRYRLRQVAVNAQQNTVTLLSSATADGSGTIDSSSVVTETRTRGIKELGAEAQAALSKATGIIAKQSLAYDRRVNNIP